MAFTYQSIKKYFYNSIGTRLATDCLNQDGSPVIKTFGVYQGQFDHEKIERVAAYPALYLRFTALQYKAQARYIQTVDGVVTLHFGYVTLDDKDISYLDILDQIQYSLQGFEDPAGNFSCLLRKAERQPQSRDKVILWEIDYSTFLRDMIANTTRRKILTTPTILNINPDPVEP